MKFGPVLFAAAAALSVSACGLKSKIDQCNAFIEKANHSQSTVSGLQLDSEDPAKLEDEAKKIDTEAKAVGGVELKDEKLTGFRNEYSTMLTKLGGVTRDLAKLQQSAKAEKDHAALEAKAAKIKADAHKLEADESKLVGDINTYCSAR